jgi:DNA polymerase (family 10)
MDKRGVANALDEAATLMELSGDNPFRIRAYQNASRTIRSLPRSATSRASAPTSPGTSPSSSRRRSPPS